MIHTQKKPLFESDFPLLMEDYNQNIVLAYHVFEDDVVKAIVLQSSNNSLPVGKTVHYGLENLQVYTGTLHLKNQF